MKIRDQFDQETVHHWNTLVGEAMEGRWIDEHLMDLPMGYRDMPEYEAVIAAEQRFWDEHSEGPVDEQELRRVIEQHMPKREQ